MNSRLRRSLLLLDSKHGEAGVVGRVGVRWRVGLVFLVNRFVGVSVDGRWAAELGLWWRGADGEDEGLGGTRRLISCRLDPLGAAAQVGFRCVMTRPTVGGVDSRGGRGSKGSP